jgi:hypothetical protein
MIVYINRKQVTIFNGAAVRDAILSYSRHSYKRVANGNLVVIDSYGNRTETDGLLKDGQSIFLKIIRQG